MGSASVRVDLPHHDGGWMVSGNVIVRVDLRLPRFFFAPYEIKESSDGPVWAPSYECLFLSWCPQRVFVWDGGPSVFCQACIEPFPACSLLVRVFVFA